MRSHHRSTFRSPWWARRRVRLVAESNGFTLVELLVAMVIGGILATVLFQFLGGQSRFVDLQNGREEVQQNSRAALELIGSELRTLPPGDALVRASADSITIRTPRVWGVICAVPSASSVEVIIPAVPGASYSANTGTGIVVNLGTAESPLWTNAVGVTAIGSPTSSCNGASLPAGSESRALNLVALPQNGGNDPVPGNVVYLYEQVTYRSGRSSTVPGLWIQRRIGDSATATNQPMAGPISEDGGLRFEYYSDASVAPLATPILDAATRASVTRVEVFVEALSHNLAEADRASKADTMLISLRNRL